MVGILKIFQSFNCLLTYFLTFSGVYVTWKTGQYPQQKTRQKPITTSSFQSVGTRKNAQNLPRSSWSSSSQWMSTLQKRSTCWRFGRGFGFWVEDSRMDGWDETTRWMGWKTGFWPTLKKDGKSFPLLKMGDFPLPAMLATTGGSVPDVIKEVCPGMRTDSHQAPLILFFLCVFFRLPGISIHQPLICHSCWEEGASFPNYVALCAFMCFVLCSPNFKGAFFQKGIFAFGPPVNVANSCGGWNPS